MNMTSQLDTEALLRDVNIEYQRVRNNNYLVQTPSPVIQAAKSTDEAAKARYEANMVLMLNENLYKVAECYSKCVAKAPNGSPELSMAYVSRSEVLFKLGKYVSCLLDVNRALMSGKYRPPLEQKLRDRKSLCMVQIRLTEEGRKIRGDEVDLVDVDEDYMTSPFNNTLLPHTVSKIGLKYNAASEKFILVATEDIEPGEILSSEEISVFGLFPNGRYHQCGHCLKECIAMIPCLSCSTVMYCSERCRRSAYDSYHRVECKIILSYYNENEWYFVHLLAIRAFLVGTQQGEKLEELMGTLSVQQIFEEGLANTQGKPFTNDYRTYLRMSAPFDLSSLNQIIPTAVQALLMLESVGFFPNGLQADEQRDLDPTGVYALALLMNHYCSHLYSPPCYLTSDESFERSANGEPFMAYLMLHSLIDYSYDPNTSAFVKKRKHTLFSLGRIKKDECLTLPYKPFFPTLIG